MTTRTVIDERLVAVQRLRRRDPSLATIVTVFCDAGATFFHDQVREEAP